MSTTKGLAELHPAFAERSTVVHPIMFTQFPHDLHLIWMRNEVKMQNIDVDLQDSVITHILWQNDTDFAQTQI
jgi:hypothetical protein